MTGSTRASRSIPPVVYHGGLVGPEALITIAATLRAIAPMVIEDRKHSLEMLPDGTIMAMYRPTIDEGHVLISASEEMHIDVTTPMRVRTSIGTMSSESFSIKESVRLRSEGHPDGTRTARRMKRIADILERTATQNAARLAACADRIGATRSALSAVMTAYAPEAAYGMAVLPSAYGRFRFEPVGIGGADVEKHPEYQALIEGIRSAAPDVISVSAHMSGESMRLSIGSEQIETAPCDAMETFRTLASIQR